MNAGVSETRCWGCPSQGYPATSPAAGGETEGWWGRATLAAGAKAEPFADHFSATGPAKPAVRTPEPEAKNCALLLLALFFTVLIKIIWFTIVLNAASLFLLVAILTPFMAFYSKSHPCKPMPVEKSWALPTSCNRGAGGRGGSALDLAGQPRLGLPPFPQKLALSPHCTASCPRAPCSSTSTACHAQLPSSAVQASHALLCFAPVSQRGLFLLASV